MHAGWGRGAWACRGAGRAYSMPPQCAGLLPTQRAWWGCVPVRTWARMGARHAAMQRGRASVRHALDGAQLRTIGPAWGLAHSVPDGHHCPHTYRPGWCAASDWATGDSRARFWWVATRLWQALGSHFHATTWLLLSVPCPRMQVVMALSVAGMACAALFCGAASVPVRSGYEAELRLRLRYEVPHHTFRLGREGDGEAEGRALLGGGASTLLTADSHQHAMIIGWLKRSNAHAQTLTPKAGAHDAQATPGACWRGQNPSRNGPPTCRWWHCCCCWRHCSSTQHGSSSSRCHVQPRQLPRLVALQRGWTQLRANCGNWRRPQLQP